MSNDNLSCYNCFESAAATVLISYGMNYQILAIGSVNFSFLCLDSLCKKGNSQVYDYREVKDFWGILGVKRINYCVNDFSEGLLKKYVENNIPVIVETDCFNCSWNALFNIQHNRHYYLINGTQLKGRDYYYIAKDPFFKVDEIMQNYLNLNNLALSFSVLLPLKDFQLDWTQILSEIKLDAKYYIDNLYASNITKVANELKGKNILELIKEENDDMNQIPFVSNMKILGNTRKSYFNLISFLQNALCKDFKVLAEDLDRCSQMWERVRFMIMRKILSKNGLDNLELISEELQKIAEIEDKIFRTILYL